MFKRFSTPLFALFALTSAVALPACDEGSDAELAEQLGLSVEELDALSAEELDVLERPSELGTPVVHTHGRRPLTLKVPTPPPTHGTQPASVVVSATPDEGCDTHGDELELDVR